MTHIISIPLAKFVNSRSANAVAVYSLHDEDRIGAAIPYPRNFESWIIPQEIFGTEFAQK